MSLTQFLDSLSQHGRTDRVPALAGEPLISLLHQLDQERVASPEQQLGVGHEAAGPGHDVVQVDGAGDGDGVQVGVQSSVPDYQND